MQSPWLVFLAKLCVQMHKKRQKFTFEVASKHFPNEKSPKNVLLPLFGRVIIYTHCRIHAN